MTMTAKELIESLSRCDPEAQVTIAIWGADGADNSSRIGSTDEVWERRCLPNEPEVIIAGQMLEKELFE